MKEKYTLSEDGFAGYWHSRRHCSFNCSRAAGMEEKFSVKYPFWYCHIHARDAVYIILRT